MDQESQSVSILGFAGSLREGSFNQALLRAAVKHAPPEMRIETFDLEPLPFYNADLDAAGPPEPVVRFKQAIVDADGLLIATPEYNYGVPALTKNAIDWASRPANDNPLIGKPVAVMGASTGRFGSVRAQLALRQSFLFTNSYAMLKPEMIVTFAGEKFEDGELVDQETLGYLKRFLTAFVDWTRRMNGS